MQPQIKQALHTPTQENLARIFQLINQEVQSYNLSQLSLPTFTVKTGSSVRFLWAPKPWILLQVLRVRHDVRVARSVLKAVFKNRCL